MKPSISVQPNENGTAVVTITAEDEDGTALIFGDFTDPKWQLMREDGTVVNDRSFALCTMTSLTFVLSAEDLAIFGGEDSGLRYISFQGTYDSNAGSDLPLTDECSFIIDRLLGQVDS
jgi:hypothetical protein